MSSKSYQIWVSYDGENQKMQLPVNPETITIKSGSSHDSVNIAGLGEILIMRSRPAVEISFSSVFPRNHYYGMPVRKSKLKRPITYISMLKNWKNGDKPVHLIVTACNVDLYCLITNFTYTEGKMAVGDWEYSISFKEYREVTVRQVAVSNETATVQDTEQRVDNTVQPQTYTVKSGDCLWNIAKKYYGSGSKYKELYNANKGVIGGNPNLIRPGQVLTLPAL